VDERSAPRFAGKRGGECQCDQLQPGYEFRRPIPLFPGDREIQRAERRSGAWGAAGSATGMVFGVMIMQNMIGIFGRFSH
jgi:hypothetical protein